jgi:Ca2+-transporting ATPase
MNFFYLKCPSGPPASQSLGIDPVYHAVMRKPPRKKDEPIIDRRIRFRVLFSATIIVAGTLVFIYYFNCTLGRSHHDVAP